MGWASEYYAGKAEEGNIPPKLIETYSEHLACKPKLAALPPLVEAARWLIKIARRLHSPVVEIEPETCPECATIRITESALLAAERALQAEGIGTPKGDA
jgi:hypothetical protein